MLKPISFKSALSFPNQSISQFYSRIKQQNELLQLVRSVLPEALALHVQHSLLSVNKLLIYTDSAVWSAQLRFYNKALLKAIETLSKDKVKVVQIKILIDPVGASQAQKETANIPSPENLATIRGAWLTAPDNELTQALRKLTNTLESNLVEPKNRR